MGVGVDVGVGVGVDVGVGVGVDEVVTLDVLFSFEDLLKALLNSILSLSHLKQAPSCPCLHGMVFSPV